MPTPWHIGVLRHEAALRRNQSIGLYGGSFNPAHEGHLHVALEALKRLDLDEIWFLVSPGNPLKSDDGMAPFKDRRASVIKLINKHPRMKTRSLECKLGTRYTADTVSALKSELPRTNFVWLMGADSLADFDKWRDWKNIAETVPIAVFDRSGYALSGFRSGLAQQYARYSVTPKQLTRNQAPAWTFVTIPRHPGSATDIRSQNGDNWYAGKNGKET